MEIRNPVSPGRSTRAVIANPSATIPATMPCVMSSSHSRIAGEAQIRTTRTKRLIDILASGSDGGNRTLHRTTYPHKRAARSSFVSAFAVGAAVWQPSA